MSFVLLQLGLISLRLTEARGIPLQERETKNGEPPALIQIINDDRNGQLGAPCPPF
jgi:phosphatidylethanolamine-binding protein (PEBP) family uncharacterized protein